VLCFNEKIFRESFNMKKLIMMSLMVTIPAQSLLGNGVAGITE